MCSLSMAHPAYIREKARQLRRDKQLTIDELVERLGLPRTTIFYWVRDIPISRKPNTTLPPAARVAAARANRRRFALLRKAAYDRGVEEFLVHDADQSFREFVCMYIGEGYKRCRNKVSIGNSNPAVVRLATHWLRRLSEKEPWFSLQYHADQDLEALRAFWALELSTVSASIAVQRKSNSGQLAGRTWRSQHGVLTVGVNDTYLRSRLQAWIDRIEGTWSELDSAPIGA
jgi:hypothetical protein